MKDNIPDFIGYTGLVERSVCGILL